MKSILLIGTILLAFATVGCQDSGPSQASPQQVKDFQGGPMPSDFAQKLKDEQAGAAKKAQSSTPGVPASK